MALPPSPIEELRARHLAFLRARLAPAVARPEWRAHLEASYDALLGRPLGALASVDDVARAIDAAFAREAVGGALEPLARAIDGAIMAELSADETAAGAYVPDAARAAFDRVATRHHALPEPLVRSVIENDTMETLMRDVLFDALFEFNQRVNPFFAEWGLPALLKRIMPIGFGTVSKSLEAVRGEFDKRLEPEIRKFLQGFSRRALAKLSTIVLAQQDEAMFVAARRSVLQWVYDQPVRSLVGAAADDSRSDVRAAVAAIAEHVAAMPAVKERRRAQIAAFFAAHGEETVGAVLSGLGVTHRPDFDALAAVTWPAVEAIVAAPAIAAWLDDAVLGFYDALAKEEGT